MDILRVALWISFGLAMRCEGKLVHFHQTFPGASGNEVQYDFGYAIDDPHTGLVTDRWEEKRGGVVKGAYSLVEPGGNIRTVDYQVDGGGGFKAVVRTRRPGHYFLSTQEFQKSNEIHQQPSPELEIPQFVGHVPQDPPINYHAINAEIVGFQKLFGKRVGPRKLLPPNIAYPDGRRTLIRPFYRY